MSDLFLEAAHGDAGTQQRQGSEEVKEYDANWDHTKLYSNVRHVLYTLPSFFESDLKITDVMASDLHSFNTGLGSTIEEQIVRHLNKLRKAWDPEELYTAYRFVRQPQKFPDVLLKSLAPDISPQILMGIELKGWYVLSKESKPSFRFAATPAVCAPPDLLVVYPWALSNVVSGTPKLFEPYLVSARSAAEDRNKHWSLDRKTKGASGITLSEMTSPYPIRKGDKILDVAIDDNSGNFGRYARTGLMDKYIESLFTQSLSGIPLYAWQKFLSLFKDEFTEGEIIRGIDNIIKALK